jgi:hypothetical protein
LARRIRRIGGEIRTHTIGYFQGSLNFFNTVKVIDIGQTTLEGYVTDAQHERVVLTREGKPIALIGAVLPEQE